MIAGHRPPTPTTPPAVLAAVGAESGAAGGGRPAALLRLLAEHPEQVVSVPHLVEELWPGVDLATGRARLHVVASRVRRSLAPGTVLEAVRDGYRLVRAAAERAVPEDAAGTPGDPETGPGPNPMVRREGALALLPAAGTVPLVVVSAPAGYGKTVLLHQWAARQAGPVAWVDLADVDDPPAALADALAGVLDAGDGHRDPQGPVAVVVDGLERVGGREVAPEVEAVVRRHLPVTLVLSSRLALALPLGRLVVRGEAVVLGPDELALTEAEAEAIRPGAGARLLRLTGGWPEAAVRLATAPDPDAPDTAPAVAPLRDRIAGDLPPDLAALLTATARLDEIRPALADAVTGRQGSGARLATLADRHLLLVRRGDHYVHRPLVCAVLGATPPDGDTRIVHLRASRWYLRHGDAERALHHAAAAPDMATVRAAFAPAVRAAAERGDADMLLRWTASVRPPTHPDAAAFALVVWALTPTSHRDRWRPRPDAPRAVVLAASAVEHLAAGRCGAARADAADARPHLVGIGPDARPVVDALLHLVDIEALVLEGQEVAYRRGVLGPQPWPWFFLWGFGIRALVAELAGRRQEAAALIDHGRARAGSPHPSWKAMAPAPWSLARALVDLDRSRAAADRADAVADIEALVVRLDGVHEPLAAVARLALHLACQRAGDEAAAARWLADADARIRALPALPLLRDARIALVQRAGATPLATLSAQERQVLGYLSTDLALGEIADALFLSPHTVKAHTRSIYRKLQVHSRAEAVAAILHH